MIFALWTLFFRGTRGTTSLWKSHIRTQKQKLICEGFDWKTGHYSLFEVSEKSLLDSLLPQRMKSGQHVNWDVHNIVFFQLANINLIRHHRQLECNVCICCTHTHTRYIHIYTQFIYIATAELAFFSLTYFNVLFSYSLMT